MTSLIVPAIVTPFVLYFAVLAQRFGGPGAAGLIAALPLQLAIGSLGVASGMGDQAVSSFAVLAATYVPAQIAYGVAFTEGMRRGGIALAVISGMAGYAIAIFVLSYVSSLIAILIGGLALLASSRFIQVREIKPTLLESKEPSAALITTLGTLGVLAVIAAVELAGPSAGAFMAAVPVLTPILSYFLMRSCGREAGAQTMAGMIRGLPSYFVLALSLALFAERTGTSVAVGIGLTLCIAVVGAIWKFTEDISAPAIVKKDSALAA